MAFATIPEALQELRAGRLIMVVDDEDRENEGDLTVAAEKITPEIINFMAQHGRGVDLSGIDRGEARPSPGSADDQPQHLHAGHSLLRDD